MNFYVHQASRRWQSALLLVAFAVVLIAMGVLIHVVVTAVSQALGQGGSLSYPAKPAVVMIALVWIMMIAGSVFRWMDVKSGGAMLARRFGAVQASDRSRDEKEQQLLNIVAEVSIASSTAQPEVYVMKHETSINAFVLGNNDTRSVIVVTQGALNAFEREQLQAVVAHEFGHIVNGDVPVNMRLLVTMGGLMAIDEVGQLLLARRFTDSFHPGVVVGYMLCALGTVGVTAGRIISAAFSRQREYLADACAVQFTRYPFALASALDVVREAGDEPSLHGVHARELAHLCFQSGGAKRWINKLMSSHPDVSLRIQAIEPQFDIKKRKVQRQQLHVLTGGNNANPSMSAGTMNFTGSSESSASVSSSNALEAAANHSLSDRIVLLLTDELKCMAALFALFAYQDGKPRSEYMNGVRFSFNDLFAGKVTEVMALVPDELAKDQLGVVNHVCRVLNEHLSIQQRQKVAIKLEKLLNVNGHYQLMDYARVQLIRRRLNIEFPVVCAIANEPNEPARARKAKSFDAMGPEFALLLSLMVESSGASPAELDAQFQRVLKCYTQDSFPRRAGSETGVIKELETAFQTLYVQPQSIRHAFVQHCIEIMQHDGIIMPSERALLDLFAASLGCEELIAA